MLAITSIKLRCISEDNNGAYKVVVIGSNANGESLVEMYDCSQQTWKILGPILDDIILRSLSDLVCCDGSYYCITASPLRIFGFTITSNEELEPTLAVPIQEPMLRRVSELQLVMCGSRLLVVAPVEQKEEVVIIWELESVNNQRHPLSTNNDTTPAQLKEIAMMPPTLWSYLKCNSRYPRFNCTGVRDNVCFITVCEMKKRIEVLVYNLGTGLWSPLPSCPWMDNYCIDDYLIMAMGFQPRLETQFQ
jgi:hypothetical protein